MNSGPFPNAQHSNGLSGSIVSQPPMFGYPPGFNVAPNAYYNPNPMGQFVPLQAPMIAPES